MNAITVTDLHKKYRTHLGRKTAYPVKGLSFAVAPNEVFGFLGRNGAGKTTTIKILCSLLKPTSGTATIQGVNAQSREARGLIGYLPENPYFYEYLTPKETIEFYGQLRGLSKSARADQWSSISEMLDLRDIADRRVRGFSKGMRQRLGFGVALVGDPDVLVLDEPMSGLDPVGRRQIRELIHTQRERGKTIFFSSHVLGDVEQICDRVGILVNGTLATEGRVSDLLHQRVDRVEVTVGGLNEAQAKSLAESAGAQWRRSGAGDCFIVDGLESANGFAQRLLGAGGSLREFTPIKMTLEDIFMEKQEPAA
jgi:ABC-2 type transport system ATP-binding protein